MRKIFGCYAEKFEGNKNRWFGWMRNTYDVSIPEIAHKLTHTEFVINFGMMIGEKHGTGPLTNYRAANNDLLHDTGRAKGTLLLKSFFETGTKYDHAAEAVKMLKANNYELLRHIVKEADADHIIFAAAMNHSKLAIDDFLLSEAQLYYCKRNRDADKLDSYRFRALGNFWPIEGWKKEDVANSTFSPEVLQAFKDKRTVDRKDVKTLGDHYLVILAFLYDLNFKASFEILKEKGYLDLAFPQVVFNDPPTQQQYVDLFKGLKEHVDYQITHLDDFVPFGELKL